MSDPGRSLVLAQVTGIRDTNLVYPSCYQCYSKVYRRQDAEQNLWQCLKCKAVHTEAEIYERYRLHLSITDDSTICDVTVFGTNVDELFGCSASHFKKSVTIKCDGTEGLLASSLEEVFVGRFFLFGFKSSPIRRRDSEKFFRTPVTLAGVIASNSRGTVKANSQQTAPALVAYQMIPMQESVGKSDFPTVIQVIKRRIQTISSTNNQRIANITRDELEHSDTTLGSTSRYSLYDQTGGNLTMSYMQSSSRNSINMTYGQPSVLLSCDRENSRAISRNCSGVGTYHGEQRLSNPPKVSHRSQPDTSNVGYQSSILRNQMVAIGNSFIKHCSAQDNQTLDLGEINFDQSIGLVSQQAGLANEMKEDCHTNIIHRPTQTRANDQVDKSPVGTWHKENRDHFDADDFNETFDPNELDPQDGDRGVAPSPHRRVVAGPECAAVQESTTKSSATFCDNLMQSLSDSCDSDSDSLLLLACSNQPRFGDQSVNTSTGERAITTGASQRISDDDKNGIEKYQDSSEVSFPNRKDCIVSKGVSNGPVTSVSLGPQDPVIDVGHSQRRFNTEQVVTDSPSGDFPEEDLPFSEDLDAFLQDMSYSQTQWSQEQSPAKNPEVLHTSQVRKESERCVLAQGKGGSTQSRGLCDKDVQNAAGSFSKQNIIETLNANNQKVAPSEDVDPLEKGSEDLFFSQEMSQQDSKLDDAKSDMSHGSSGSTTTSPNRILDEDIHIIEQSQNSSDPGSMGSTSIPSGSLTSVSAGPHDTVIDVGHSQRRSNTEQIVTNSPSADFPEEDLPFSEDLDAFLQDMSYSQTQWSQQQSSTKSPEVTTGVTSRQKVLHTNQVRKESERCVLAQGKGGITQSRGLCDKDVQNAARSYVNENITENLNVNNQKVAPLEQDVDPLENGSEDLFFTQEMSQQDSKLDDAKSDMSHAGSSGANSQSMILFSGSELFSESDIDYEPDTKSESCTEDNKGHSVKHTSSGVKSVNQAGLALDKSLTSISNILRQEKSENKFTSRVLGQGTKAQSQYRDLIRTPQVKNVQFAGFLTEQKDIAHIDLKMRTKPTPVARTRRKSCLKSAVSFVPCSVSPLQVLQSSSPGIVSTQMDLFSPSPEVLLRQQTSHRLNTTLHSTPVITSSTRNRVSHKGGSYSVCSSPDDSLDIIPSSAVRPSRMQLLGRNARSEVTKAKVCHEEKENVVSHGGFREIQNLSYSNARTAHIKLYDQKLPTRELNQTVDSVQSQEMSQDLFSSAQSGDLFSDCSWEEDVDICKKLF